MPGRRVLVEIVKGMEAEGRGAEGLRAVVGLQRAFEAHSVRILFRGDGVAWVKREGGAPEEMQGLLAHLRILDLPRVVDAESLESHGMTGEDVQPGVEVADRARVEAFCKEAEAHLVY